MHSLSCEHTHSRLNNTKGIADRKNIQQSSKYYIVGKTVSEALAYKDKVLRLTAAAAQTPCFTSGAFVHSFLNALFLIQEMSSANI